MSQSSYQQGSDPVSPVYQLVLMIISGSLIMMMYMYRLNHFRAQEHIPKLNAITPEIRASFPTRIDVGFLIQTYEKFDVVRNSFILVGHIWFAYDPGTISLDVIDQFNFERSDVLYKSKPQVSIVDEKILVKYKVRLSFSAPFNYKDFPLNEHIICISLTNKMLAPTEAYFITLERNFEVSAVATEFGWKRRDKAVASGFETTVLGRYDGKKTIRSLAAHFTIEYAHNSTRNIMSIILPLILIFYLSLFALSMRSPYQTTACIAAVTGIITYRFVIDNLSPQVGYFMISDYLFITCLIGSFLTLVITLLDTFGTRITLRIKRGAILILHIMLAIANAYFSA